MEFIFALAVSLAAGSTITVLAARVPAGKSFVLARSRCPACSHVLAPADLIPLFSWLSTSGRCRYCAAPIPVRYPLTELAAMAIALWASAVVDPPAVFWASCILGWGLLTLSLIDARHLRLPDVLTLPLIAGGIAFAAMQTAQMPWDNVLGAITGYLVFVAIAGIYAHLRGHTGLGRGDAKLLAAAGAWLTWAGLPSVVLVACASAFAWVAVRAVGSRGIANETPIAFGPHLAIAIWIVWLYGPLTVSG